jgi:hypothetical protein
MILIVPRNGTFLNTSLPTSKLDGSLPSTVLTMSPQINLLLVLELSIEQAQLLVLVP